MAFLMALFLYGPVPVLGEQQTPMPFKHSFEGLDGISQGSLEFVHSKLSSIPKMGKQGEGEQGEGSPGGPSNSRRIRKNADMHIRSIGAKLAPHVEVEVETDVSGGGGKVQARQK